MPEYSKMRSLPRRVCLNVLLVFEFVQLNITYLFYFVI